MTNQRGEQAGNSVNGPTGAGLGLAALSSLGAAEAQPAVKSDAVRTFRINIPQAKLDDLRRRIVATQWPEKETVADKAQGVQLARMQKLARYWATDYDWRKVEARLNGYPQFLTDIDGLGIHFIHVRSKHENALPVIVTHGWPGSVVEQLKIIEPLTNPTAHGGSAADAFHVVIPSIPGYGFSGKPSTTGWDPVRIARAWTMLMKRLGYRRFVAQGGDWGSIITEQLGVQAPPELIAIHTNLPSAVPTEVFAALSSHAPPPGMPADEKHAFERLDAMLTHGLSYALEMASRPQTVSYGLTDSPAGLLGWMCEKFDEWTDSGGDAENVLTRDEMLDDVTLYWVTNSAASSSRLYWENKLAFFAPTGVKVPVAVSAFAGELYQCPRSWAERAYPQLIHYNTVDKGGHFAAWEQPESFCRELRAGFRSIRRA